MYCGPFAGYVHVRRTSDAELMVTDAAKAPSS